MSAVYKIDPAEVAAFAKTEDFQKGREQLNALLARASTDREFRQQLIENPREALTSMGQEYDPNLDIRFVEKQGHATIVLPDFVDPAAELSSQDLEMVAGGATLGAVVITVTTNTVCLLVGAGVVIGYTIWG